MLFFAISSNLFMSDHMFCIFFPQQTCHIYSGSPLTSLTSFPTPLQHSKAATLTSSSFLKYPSTLFPQGLRICCSLCADYIYSNNSRDHLRFLVKCHIREASPKSPFLNLQLHWCFPSNSPLYFSLRPYQSVRHYRFLHIYQITAMSHKRI